MSASVLAQKHEYGGGLGALFYTGDLQNKWVMSHTNIGGTFLFRSNVKDHLSMRLAFVGGKLAGSDQPARDAFSSARGASFDIFLSEFSGSLEYNFLDFRNKHRYIQWTPYFHGGIALFGMAGVQDKRSTYSNVQLAVPIGIGFKYVINPKWVLAVEYGARFTFFDYLDNISEGDPFVKDYQYGNMYDNDMYHFIGVTLSHVIWKVPCPIPSLKPAFGRQ